jgi:hypothetical protein
MLRVPAGKDTWLNPVEPPTPAGYVPGELHLSSQKAAAAVRAAATAAGLPDSVANGVKDVEGGNMYAQYC